MAFADILAAQGVLPVSAVTVVTGGGMRDILAMQGVLPLQAEPAVVDAAVRSWSQLAGVWVDGSEQIEVEPDVPLKPTGGGAGGGRGSGPTTGIQEYGYRGHRDQALEETRRKRILLEDDDIVALIMAMVTRDML